MSRFASVGIRSLCVALALVVGAQFLQPRLASADPIIALSKTACTFTVGGGCSTGVTANVGDIVKYVITYTNNGTAGAITISDILQQPGVQQYITGSCVVPAGSGATCGASGTTPISVNFAFPVIAAGATGTVSFNVQIVGGAGSIVTNYATATNAGFTYGASNVTNITIGGGPTPPPTGTVTVSKAVRDYTTGGSYAANINVGPNDSLQYRITLTNISLPANTTFTIQDALQSGQSLVQGSCQPFSCAQVGNTVAFTVPGMTPGTSMSVTFVTNVLTPGVYGGLVISNMASATWPSFGYVNSNTTTATVSGTPSPAPCTSYNCTYNYCNGYYYPGYCPTSYPYSCGPVTGCISGYPFCTQLAPCNYNYWPYCSFYFNCPFYPQSPVVPTSCVGTAGSCGPFGALTLCGPVTAFNAPSSVQSGSITISGETLGVAPGAIITGTPITVPGPFCFTISVNSAGQASSIVVSSNLVGTNYACGTVSSYTPGYMPWSGFSPYPGYTAYPGYSPYSGYGPYAIPTGNWAGWYGWGGPLMLSGYPFQVPSNVYFPNSFQYGNPYCFLLGQNASVTASLSVVPTLATPLDEDGGWYHMGSLRVS